MEDTVSTNMIADIHCPNCGAPAAYDIRSGVYACQHCGGKVTVDAAQAQKRGFRDLQQAKMQSSASKYRLQHASCSGCGAEVVFEEDEALANCAFCGRALVRKKYLHKKNLPEIVIPFQITKEEAGTDVPLPVVLRESRQKRSKASERENSSPERVLSPL